MLLTPCLDTILFRYRKKYIEEAEDILVFGKWGGLDVEFKRILVSAKK